MITLKELEPGIPFNRTEYPRDTAMYVKLSSDQEFYREPAEGHCRAINTRSGSAPTILNTEMVRIVGRPT